VIATMKVLGLRAAAPGAVAAAAYRVVRYVEGGSQEPHDQPEQAGDESGLADYYDDGEAAVDDAGEGQAMRAAGEARGSAAELVGLRGRVRAERLRRLLTGRHAITGRPLLPPGGSAGRAAHATLDAAPDQEMLTLAEAARLAGVSRSICGRWPARTPSAWRTPGTTPPAGPVRTRTRARTQTETNPGPRRSRR
jgi:hypothetical protein